MKRNAIKQLPETGGKFDVTLNRKTANSMAYIFHLTVTVGAFILWMKSLPKTNILSNNPHLEQC